MVSKEGDSGPAGPEDGGPELEELRSRVQYIGDGVVLYREVPNYTLSSLRRAFDLSAELARQHGATVLISDLGEVGRRPDAAAREEIIAGMRRQPDLRHFIVITGKRLLFNVALKFIFSALAGVKTSVYGTLDEARAALQDEQRRR